MAQSNDLLAGNFATNPGSQAPKPATVASAATIAVTGFLTFVSGTVQIATITPPLDGPHMIALVFTNANPAAFTGAGNVQSTKDPAQNELVLLAYDPNTAKYYVVN
jgi:hypothetical protein